MPTVQQLPPPKFRYQRIALCIHAMQGGGAERVMSQLANHWSREHEVHLLTWADQQSDAYPLSPRIVRHGLKLQSTSTGVFQAVLANWQRVRRLRAALASIDPQFVLSFCDQMNIVTLEAMRPMPNIAVWIAEHSDPQHQQLSRPWEAWRRRNYPRSTGCIALTEPIAEFMTRWIPAQRIRVIPNALMRLPESNNYQAQSSSPYNTLLFVGRLSEEKRLDLLLDAWQMAHDQLPQWQLRIVGDGPARASLQFTARTLPRVDFVGWSSEPEQYYQTSQLFVLSSRYEGFPMALIEALSYGLPAVSTNCSSALKELSSTADPACLRVIQHDSATELAATIVALARDPLTRQQMSVSARQVAQHYTWESIVGLWDQLLSD